MERWEMERWRDGEMEGEREREGGMHIDPHQIHLRKEGEGGRNRQCLARRPGGQPQREGGGAAGAGGDEGHGAPGVRRRRAYAEPRALEPEWLRGSRE